MKFNNPWIDPRVQSVRANDAQAYLLRHGWKPVPFPRRQVRLFAGPIGESGEPITQMVPADEKGDDYVQCIVELITTLALLEDRTAVAVLDDILGQSSANGPPRAIGKKNSRPSKSKHR